MWGGGGGGDDQLTKINDHFHLEGDNLKHIKETILNHLQDYRFVVYTVNS